MSTARLRRAGLIMMLYVLASAFITSPGSLASSRVAFASPDYDRTHEACQMTPVATETLWTPVILLTSPYSGSSVGSVSSYSWGSFTFAFADNGLTSETSKQITNSISATNGEVIGLFEADNWTIYQLQTVWRTGIGNNNPCKASYTAEITGKYSGFATFTLFPPGSTSDSGVITSFTGYDPYTKQTYSSVELPSLDYTTLSGGIDTCNVNTGYSYGVTASQWISGTIGIDISGYHVSGSLAITQGAGNSVTYTYNFPSGGVWSWSVLSGQASPGLTFSYSPCT